MNYYLAPLERITGYIYRKAYNKYFHNVNKYFTPFITPNKNGKYNYKESKGILKENNKGIFTVPQILTNNAKDFIETSKELKDLGYSEINLNLGCPSRTVVSKKKGSGFLSELEELENFLEEVFLKNDINISIKTRIGKDSPEEFYEIIKIFNKYPLEELIIHPRTQRDFYNNKPNLKIFEDGLNTSKNKVCYNGDIFTKRDCEIFEKKFPQVDKIMLGRGIIGNPGLVNEINTGEVITKKILLEFHNEILEGYEEILSGDRNVLFKMKELWSYMIYMFSNNKKYWKRIKKCQNLENYKIVVSQLFELENIMEKAGYLVE